MIRLYKCLLCDWEQEADSILPFNKHASTVHRDFFYEKDVFGRDRRNNKTLRHYVDCPPTSIESDIKRSK